MAKLAMFAAVLVAILAVEATAHLTTITTTVVEDEVNQMGPGGSQMQRMCEQKIQQRQQQLRRCQEYLSQMSPFNLNMYPQQGKQMEQQQCCNALQMVGEECACEAVRHVVKQQQKEGGSWQGEQAQQVMQKARFLPKTCNMKTQECQIRVVMF